MAENLIAITEGSGKNVSTQSMTINSQTVHIERSMMGMGVVTLPGTAQIIEQAATGLVPASAIDLQGRYYIVLKVTYSTTSNFITFRFAFYDSADVLIGYSDLMTIDNINKSDGGSRYFGLPVVYANVFGAKSFKVSVESISAGNVTIFAGVV